jgi:TIR domain
VIDARERLIGIWHDQMLRPGEHLDRAIEAQLAAAKLVILLVSPDFISSDYCTEKEMRRAFARAKDKKCKVVPVILKSCQWRTIPLGVRGKLSDFLVIPQNGRPVTEWPKGRDAAWDHVVTNIRLIINEFAPGTAAPSRQRLDRSPRGRSAPPRVAKAKAKRALEFSSVDERKRVSVAAITAFLQIVKRWHVRDEDARTLLGGMISQRTLDRMKAGRTQWTLPVDTLTRISYIMGIYKALQIVHSRPFADKWVNERSGEHIFKGQTPLAYMIQGGIPAMSVVRRELDDATDIQPRTKVRIEIERDVWLADAIWRAFLGTWDLPPHGQRVPEGECENQRFYDLVTKNFRQAAFDGHLPTWAKRSNSDLWEVVPKEFWKDHRISYLNVVREDPTKLSVEKAGSLRPSNEWREFMTSKRAVDAHQWPSAHRSSGDQRASASRVSSPSPSSDDELTCPICKTTAKPLDKLGDAEGFECLAHDRFRVSESVLAVPALRNSPGRRWEDALRRARARQPGETAPTIMTYDFD